jgi:nucleotide-binding universal stress UspA family protein
MPQKKKILVATDGSEPAEVGVKYAARLGEKTGLPVVAFFVLDKHEYLIHAEVDGKERERLEREGRAALERAWETCTAHGIECTTESVEGYSHEEIIKRARGDDIALIVMGAKGKDYLKKRVLGSVTLEVVKQVGLTHVCPVVVVPLDRKKLEI